jgi:hypothetical protein
VKLKLVAVCSTAALVVCGAAAAGNAAALGNPGQKQSQSVKAYVAALAQITTRAQGSRVDVGAVFDAAVAYLQIDKQTLFQKLKNGQSLAQIAVAQGKTADGLVNAVVAAAQTQLDAAVTAGKLSAAKEQALLTKLRTKLGTLATKSAGGSASRPSPSRPSPVTMFLQPLLAYLHLDISTVLNELRSGKSLAQIAVAHGKTADGLVASIVAAAKTPLDAAVVSGHLTAAQEATFVSKLQTTVAALVNRSHG